MAGAGYKLFNTGDVLTAAQVNTYLQEQTVMVFASAAARTTALTGVVAEGMISYLTDTDVVQYYNGTTWTTINTDQTPLTTKGDLFTFSTQDARLAVGSNGETLVADSSSTTGLRWQENYSAGKNKIINGDFGIWQRGTSFSNPSSGAYIADRFAFIYDGSGSTRTLSRQTFSPGAAPVAGYEGSFFWRNATTVAGTGGNFQVLAQLIEDVRTFAGETITFSFWAKADASRSITANVIQHFGSGGSSDVFVGQVVNTTLTTGWVRYQGTVAMPSLSGKTIGTNSYIKVEIAFPLNTVMTIDTWGWQFEASNTATAFQTATGTLAGELAACQRYYQVFCDTSSYGEITGQFYSTTAARFTRPLLVSLRTTNPTITFPSGTFTNFIEEVGVANRTPTAFSANGSSKTHITFSATGMTGATTNTMAAFTTSATAITISSEL